MPIYLLSFAKELTSEVGRLSALLALPVLRGAPISTPRLRHSIAFLASKGLELDASVFARRCVGRLSYLRVRDRIRTTDDKNERQEYEVFHVADQSSQPSS